MEKKKGKKMFVLTPNEKRILQNVFQKDGKPLPERTLRDTILFKFKSEQARTIRRYIREVMGIKPRYEFFCTF